MSATTRVCAAAVLAAGLMAASAPGAVAQAPKVPEWQVPEGFDAGGGRQATSRQAPSGNLGAPMRKIDRSEIDMTGVGREVRDYGSGIKPMINGGSMGVGGGF